MPKLDPKGRRLNAIPYADSGQAEHKDPGFPGLALRVGKRTKTWVLTTRVNRNGRRIQSRIKLGTYPPVELAAARTLANDTLLRIADGADPTKDKRRESAHGYETVLDDFLDRHVSKLRTGHQIKVSMNRETRQQWGNRPIEGITRRDVIELVDNIAATGKTYAAHNTFAYLRKFFNWCIDRGLLDHSPCDRIRPGGLIGQRLPRQRILADAELKDVWKAAEATPYHVGPFVQLLILTGQRLREVAEMKWSEIDLEAGLWSLPPERTKANAAHVVPLAPLALDVIKHLPRHAGPYVFSTKGGKKPIAGFSDFKERIDKASGVTDWRFHDLRRTMRSHLSALPVQDIVRELVIGHARPGLHKVYDQHAYMNEKREALELWEQRLVGIVRAPEKA